MHPDLSGPAAKDRRDRLIGGAERRRALRTIDGGRHFVSPGVAVRILLHRWPWRWPTKDDCGVALEHCSAKLLGHLE